MKRKLVVMCLVGAFAFSAQAVMTDVFWNIGVFGPPGEDWGTLVELNEVAGYYGDVFSKVHLFVVINDYGDQWEANSGNIIGMFNEDSFNGIGDKIIDYKTWTLPVTPESTGLRFVPKDEYSEEYLGSIYVGTHNIEDKWSFGLVLFYEYAEPTPEGATYLWILGSTEHNHAGDGDQDVFLFLPGTERGTFVIPEPATGLLALAGIGLLLAQKRKRA